MPVSGDATEGKTLSPSIILNDFTVAVNSATWGAKCHGHSLSRFNYKWRIFAIQRGHAADNDI